jgi:hypothetical protein
MKQRGVRSTRRRTDERKAHLISEERHDPYKARGKRAGPCTCPGCGAVWEAGRWRWTNGADRPAARATCPACHRIADRFPAGEVRLSGGFALRHRDEIMALARNTEARERAEHPLQRIMDVEEGGESATIRTTGIHLPRRIGHAIVDAYKGEIETHYDEAGHFLRVTWHRDA